MTRQVLRLCQSQTACSALPLAAAVFVLGLIASGCSKSDKNAYAPPPPPEVIIAHPIERDVTGYLSFTGVVEASETVELRARVQGFLEKINFQPGQRVKKGDVLFVIDKRQYIADVNQATAAVDAQEASYLGAQNDAKMARELADERAGPEIDAIIKAAKRDSLKAEVARAKANLEQAKLNLEYCDITAPIDGRITRNMVDVGNLVGRGEATLLAQIVQASPAFVSIDASESDVLAVRRDAQRSNAAGTEPGQIAPGQWRPSELALAGETQFNIKGRVDYVEPQLNPQTLTLRVRTRYDNADEVLIPGLFSQVRFAMSNTKAIVAPEAALLSDQQGRYAMVLNEKDEVEQRRVKIGILDGTMRVVEEGLTPKDRMIVVGVLKARPGAKVTPKMQDQAAR